MQHGTIWDCYNVRWMSSAVCTPHSQLCLSLGCVTRNCRACSSLGTASPMNFVVVSSRARLGRQKQDRWPGMPCPGCGPVAPRLVPGLAGAAHPFSVRLPIRQPSSGNILSVQDPHPVPLETPDASCDRQGSDCAIQLVPALRIFRDPLRCISDVDTKSLVNLLCLTF